MNTLKFRTSAFISFLVIGFALESICNPIYGFATVSKKRRTSSTSSASLVQDVETPKRTKVWPTLHLSPESAQLNYVIYLIHDGEEDFWRLPKLDFENEEKSKATFLAQIAPILNEAKKLRENGELMQIHRYIGLVSQKKIRKSLENRTVENRFNEHASTCNSRGWGSEKRLCLGLQKSAQLNRKVHMTALIHNIHPSQISAFESYLIDVFGGLEDLGWNSNTGSGVAYRKFFNSNNDAARKLVFQDASVEGANTDL